MERLAELLKTKTQKTISVEGHTDNVGSLAGNQKLSDLRALAVRNALAALGVPESRMRTEGLAFNRPVVSNSTEEGRRMNRRTELIVLDEKVETITQGEAPGAFEAAFSKLKDMVEKGLVKPLDASGK